MAPVQRQFTSAVLVSSKTTQAGWHPSFSNSGIRSKSIHHVLLKLLYEIFSVSMPAVEHSWLSMAMANASL